MYCTSCGKQIDANNSFCTGCGVQINKVSVQEDSGKKIVSIILGCLGIFGAMLIIFAPVSLIITIVGLILAVVVSKKEKNTVGIVLNVIGVIISILMILAMSLIMLAIFRYAGSGYEYVEEIHEVEDHNREYY